MPLKHLLRRLVHVPMFTSVTLVTLAIGIGANAAIFSVIEAVLLRPLPYPRPDELIAVDHAAPGVSLERAGIAPFLYFTYRDDGQTMQDIGMWRSDTVSLTGLREPQEVPSLQVTDGILPILGVQPALGRRFSQRDDSPGNPETVILTHGFWQAKFGGSASAIGQRIMLDGRPREIIGVLPDSFRFLDMKPDLVVPFQLDRSKTFLGNFSYSALARLKPGTTILQATSDLSRMIPVAIKRFPPFPGYNAKMFEDARLAPSLRSLKEDLIGDVSRVLWVLMGTLGMVLLIACANVANLLLVRAEGRQQELAIRAALGAGWGQIARELLLESVALAVVGGMLGLGLAYGAVRLLTALAPANLPRLDQISIDPPVLLFTVVVSFVAGLLFGSIPVVKYAGPHLATALRAGGRSLSDSKERHRARSTLVVVQVALALVLLVSAGLMIRTFQALKHVQPGFTRPENLQTLQISIPGSAVKDPIQVARIYQDILDKIAAIPGVSSVGLTTLVPMSGQSWHDPIFAADRVYGDSEIPPLRLYKFLSPGLLKTMGNTVVAGRDFTWTDLYERRPVVMVSENMARELWREPSAAIGKRIRERLKGPWREVVGVVSDERDDGVNQKAPTFVAFPILLTDFGDDPIFVSRSVSFMIRSNRTGSSGFLTEISRAVWSVNPNLPLANVRSLQEVYDRSLARTSFALVMLAIAGAMALLLGVAGIYGVISYSVSQRTREIGIRMALGAQDDEVTRMFVRHGLGLASLGVAIGLVAAVLLTRLLSTLLFDVNPVDPLTYAAVSLGLVAAALVASYVPAVRATMIDPVEALRAE